MAISMYACMVSVNKLDQVYDRRMYNKSQMTLVKGLFCAGTYLISPYDSKRNLATYDGVLELG